MSPFTPHSTRPNLACTVAGPLARAPGPHHTAVKAARVHREVTTHNGKISRRLAGFAVSAGASFLLLGGSASASSFSIGGGGSGNSAVLSGLSKLSSQEDSELIRNPFAVRYQRMSQARESLGRVPQFVALEEFDKARLQLRNGPGMQSLRKDLREVQMSSPISISSGMTTEVLQALEALDQGLKNRLPGSELSALTKSLLSKYDAVLGQLPR